MKHFQVHKNFYNHANSLRSEFDENFVNPRSTQSKRFVWDYWYFENKYHLIRTPAFYYFTKKVYENFHSHLVQWGRENLGCHDVSPTWLSYYVDGCYQNIHSDVPHGPWAFVYSLTVNPNLFLGGETFILKPEVLNYWPSFQDSVDRESESFMDYIKTGYNQLTVFDPRFPHGVTEVKGTRDPMKGRVVIHGWFVEPRPYVVGGLSTTQVQDQLMNSLAEFSNLAQQKGSYHGTLSVKLNINKNGLINKYELKTNTLLALDDSSAKVNIVLSDLKKNLSKMKFAKKSKDSVLVVPILFK